DQSERCANATATQLFYLANVFHDLMFLYGFDENSGNFQQYNFERSEGERDAVILDVQDGHEFEYTIFKTPPDGRSRRCQLNIWNFCDPFGDEELETRALLGSLSHGLAARLTGGPRDSSCLANGEAGGLGLGWASFIPKTIRDGTAHIDYTLNVWPEHPDYQISLHGRILPQGSLMYDYLLRRDYREL
ncbi:Fungalysin/Thermolysin Extracellular metalloproteinase 5, partial [Ceratobasidium sp. UAMH 11750]